MIPFFRKIRKKMAEDNKPLKYLRYAIGEIVLVVIGILIALSINNWNESEKQSKKSEKLIIRLENQIELNLETTQEKIDRTKTQIKSMLELMSILGNPSELNDQTKIDKLLYSTLNDHYLGLDLNTLNEAQDNGEIAGIKKDSLRSALYKLSSIIRNIEKRETIANTDNLNFMVPYFYKNTNFRNINSNLNNNYNKKIGRSRLEKNNYIAILTDREFENLLDSRIFYAEECLSSYVGLKQYLDNIKKLLGREK